MSNKSISLPGVATHISHPLVNSIIWFLFPSPPYKATVLMPVLKDNFLLSLLTWIANSLVGTNIKDSGNETFLFLFSVFCSFSVCSSLFFKKGFSGTPVISMSPIIGNK